MLAGLEALVKPSEVMKSLGRIPPGDGGSAEQGQGGPESRTGVARFLLCNSPLQWPLGGPKEPTRLDKGTTSSSLWTTAGLGAAGRQ